MKKTHGVRNLLIVGFVISFAGLIFNAIFLANITNKLNTVRAEQEKIEKSLQVQTDLGNDAQSKFEKYLILEQMANLLPEEKKEEAKFNAANIFNDAMILLYSSANDISLTDFRKVEAEFIAQAEQNEPDAAGELESNESENNESEKSEPETEPPSAEDQQKLAGSEFREAIKVLNRKENYYSEEIIKEKLLAIRNVTMALVVSNGFDDFLGDFGSLQASINRMWVNGVQTKRDKISELEEDRRYFEKVQSYSTIGAIVLQMFGLAFVFLKDFALHGEKKFNFEEVFRQKSE